MNSVTRIFDSNRRVAVPNGYDGIKKYLAEIAALARDAAATSNLTIRRDSIQVLVMQIETLQNIASVMKG